MEARLAPLSRVSPRPSAGLTMNCRPLIYSSFTILCLATLFGRAASSEEDRPTVPLKAHPLAVPNTHAPGEVDNPQLVPFVVADPRKLEGIVVDETTATLVGKWQYSTHTPPYVGLGYLHDQKSGKGEKSVTFTPDLPVAGIYEVRLSHCYNVRRSTNTPITIHHADGETVIRINQQEVPEHKRLFRTLGQFRFDAGRTGWLRISTSGTDGKYVIADAVQFLPVAANLRGNVIDADSGQPVAARVTIRHADGRWFFPKSASPGGSAVDYRKNRAGSPAMHTTLSADPFVAELPPGKYVLTAQRGKETLPARAEITIDDRATSVTLELKRWIHMARRGWFSGDTHSHRLLSETPNLVLAEDLNLAFPLSHWVTVGRESAVAANRIKAPAPQSKPVRVDDDHWIYPRNTEYEIFSIGGRRHELGAVVIIGHTSLFDRGAPPARPVAEQAHAEGALLDLEKHSWAWSLMTVAVMDIDLFELSNNHVWPGPFQLGTWTLKMNPAYMTVETNANGFTEWGWIDYGFQTYYALLNCGFRLQPTAGTGSGVHPVPLGFGRVYVHQPDGFTYKNWMRQLKAGRCFVTTGPMLMTTVNGRPPGHVFVKARPDTPYKIAGTVESRREVDRVEVIVNGQLAQTLTPISAATPDGGFTTPIAATVTPAGSSWIATRVFTKHEAGRVRFAHSSPVHIEVAGQPLRPRPEEVAYIVGHLEREVARHRGVLTTEELAEFESALATYKALMPE